ncbi:chemotaxis protein CheW [Evansella sp. LMS18]|uniref:chemotaxis protein CheW n=1 Tax=Evansella sp. LMS18 TaxID=2924033 RepID=UPI0020D094A5|nr:chemotaxis protein CheW [Evansella sp. LMS18]UTR12075.1 chemotaxis protein CheW [Evansella sp. LMS18]
MENTIKVIVFQLHNEQYGVNIQQVRSIEKLQNVTPVPGTAEFIKGVINLRGDITPIIALKDRLQIGKTEYTDHTRVLIINIESIQMGLIVDNATDVLDIEQSIIDAPPEVIGGVTEEYLSGVAKIEDRLLILLDLERILNFQELNEVEKAAAKQL